MGGGAELFGVSDDVEEYCAQSVVLCAVCHWCLIFLYNILSYHVHKVNFSDLLSRYIVFCCFETVYYYICVIFRVYKI